MWSWAVVGIGVGESRAGQERALGWGVGSQAGRAWGMSQEGQGGHGVRPGARSESGSSWERGLPLEEWNQLLAVIFWGLAPGSAGCFLSSPWGLRHGPCQEVTPVQVGHGPLVCGAVGSLLSLSSAGKLLRDLEYKTGECVGQRPAPPVEKQDVLPQRHALFPPPRPSLCGEISQRLVCSPHTGSVIGSRGLYGWSEPPLHDISPPEAVCAPGPAVGSCPACS